MAAPRSARSRQIRTSTTRKRSGPNLDIKWVVATSGGLGSGPSSLWTFGPETYAAFDRLRRRKEAAVSQAYATFFSAMVNVSERVRDEVIFI